VGEKIGPAQREGSKEGCGAEKKLKGKIAGAQKGREAKGGGFLGTVRKTENFETKGGEGG